MLKKIKRRYLALKIDSDEPISSNEFMDAVWSAVLKLYGEYGASRVGLALIGYDMERRFAVIRVAHTSLEMIRTSLASMTKIGDKPAAVHVLTVSGTVKALCRKVNK